MIIYICRFTSDEMLSDAFKPNPVVDNNGNEVPGLMEVESLQVDKDSGASINIGCGDQFGGSAEGASFDGAVEYVNNIIDKFDYHEVSLSKKDLKEYLKAYCNALRHKLRDDDNVPITQVKAFTQAAPIFSKWILSMHKELQFYTSTSLEPDGSMAFAYFKEGGSTPTFVYIKAGFVEEKC